MNKFKQNELVWAKFDDYPWWPGVIKREVPPSQFEILFCGDDAKALIPKKYIAKWEKNFDQLTSKIEDKDLLFSVGIALKLQEGIFDFKDHVEFITNSNKEEIVKEMIEFLNFNQSEIDNIKHQKSNDTFLKRKRTINKKENLLIHPEPNQNKAGLIDSIYQSIAGDITQLTKSLNIINEYKGKITSKLAKCQKDRTVISKNNLESIDGLIDITSQHVDKSFSNLISPYIPLLDFQINQNNPFLFYGNIKTIKSLYNKELYEESLNKYKNIYDLTCAILEKLEFGKSNSFLPEEEKNVEMIQAGRKNSENDLMNEVPNISLQKFFDSVNDNQHLIYKGYKFRANEITNKHTKHFYRKRIKDALIDVFVDSFYYIEHSFLNNIAGGLEVLCSKIDKKIELDYVSNIEIIMNITNTYINGNKTSLTQEKHYDLSLDF